MTQFVFIDTEFNQTSEENVNPVCAVCSVNGFITRFDTRIPGERDLFKCFINDHILAGSVFVSYAFTAEARFFRACGIDILDPRLRAVDLFIEYSLLLNHNDDLAYGSQLIDGKIKHTRKPNRWRQDDDDDEPGSHQKPSYSLAAATYKLLGEQRDTEHKDKMRDLIIAGGPFSPEDFKAIMDYCEEDVVHLPALHKEMNAQFKNYVPDVANASGFFEEQVLRARYAALTAEMESIGMPLDVVATKRFIEAIPKMTRGMQLSINENLQIPLFRQVSKSCRVLSMDTKLLKAWIESTQDLSKWPKTETDGISLASESWEKICTERHTYSSTVPGQMLRWTRFQQSLNGFKPDPKGKKKTVLDATGSDGRTRPYFGIFRAQSSRSQPSATAFIPLKAAWMRCLLQPKPGKMMVSFDYSSEEILVGAYLSGDKAYLRDYHSGDCYLAFGKRAGGIPADATKESHSELRDLFKSTELGVQYGMGAAGLAVKLTGDTGKPTTPAQAQELIDLFWSSYPDYAEFVEGIKRNYQADGYIKLPYDGWMMLGDNDNWRSYCNCPVQGAGAAIMRLAVAKAFRAGLRVSYTLHDALTIECDHGDFASADVLAKCMVDAFREIGKEEIRVEGNAWGPGFGWKGFTGKEFTPGGRPIKVQGAYIDKRSAKEFWKFSEHLYGDGWFLE